MSSRYPIPAKTVRTEIIVKRSRFITTAGHADTVEAARGFIQQVRDEMPDATHHVYAFRIGYGSSVNEGFSDDGEPAGTSGKPVMSALRGAQLGDTVIVVTRYFGGTKLGTGGLVRAYSSAAKEALAILPVTENVSPVSLKVQLPYSHYEPFKRLLHEYEAQILDEHFSDIVRLKIRVPQDMTDDFSAHAREYTLDNTPPEQL